MRRDQKWNSCHGLTQRGWRLSGCKLLNSESDVGIVPSAERGKEMDTEMGEMCFNTEFSSAERKWTAFSKAS